MLRTVRNSAEWKSDNFRIKETAFIQTGRRGGDVETWNGLVLYPHVVDKNLEGNLGNEGS